MMFKKLLEWCDDDDDEGNEKYDNTEKKLYLMRAETLLPVAEPG